ncbi:MAG: aminomethyl-transferring glycine dehydrogenase subunit GcvPB [Thermoproteota archaeon]|nr:MAG: aminomethyl-transferring glycine dehydrogenase subunit GcvPB [Candidatus Korarchaeota archaeon]
MNDLFRQAKWQRERELIEPTVFELSQGRSEGYYRFSIEKEMLDAVGDVQKLIPSKLRREELNLPNLSEPEVVRHFSRLAEMNYGVDSGPYWLGSCTMKYNPKINERIAASPKVRRLHPYQPEETVQGALKIMYELGEMLGKITGLRHWTFQTSAGAHGEYLGCSIIRAYQLDRGEKQRDEMLIPLSAHGSNFASAAMAGFKVIKIPVDSRGCTDMGALRAAAGERTAGMMITNPNTLGIFEEDILEIADLVHNAGGLLYYDGANLNALLGRVLLSAMGVDVAHLNLHKTFSTPHGTGGPGAGAVLVRDGLEDFLPVPVLRERDGRYYFDYNVPKSVGRIKAFYGNFEVLVKAWAYLKALGSTGLREVSGIAVLNANYAFTKIKGIREVSVIYGEDRPRKHEFVISLKEARSKIEAPALHVAKRLLDYGLHPPTIYFPPVVEEAFMMEPTETDSKEEIDHYIEVMRKILEEELEENPKTVLEAPHNSSIDRLDEVRAAREPILSWKIYERYYKGNKT